MSQRKRPTRSIQLDLAAPKPRNPILQAASHGQVKLGTAKHKKSKGAERQALKIALRKAEQDSI